MFKKICQFLLPLGLAGFILGTLSFEAYNPQPLPPPSGYVLSKDNEDQVYIEAKALNFEETGDYAHRDLMKRGYQPILLQIDNTSPFSYELRRDLADIHTAGAKRVVREIGKSAIPRKVAFQVLGFLFWPLSIPGTIDSVRTWNQEYKLNVELSAKTLKPEGEIIPPYSSLSRLLFVRKDLIKESFQLSLFNLEHDHFEDYFVVIES